MQKENRRNTISHLGSSWFVGTVTSTDPGTMVITLAPDGQQNLASLQGIPLANQFAHALGFKETTLPTIGSRVLCYGGYGGFCLIVGTIPAIDVQSSGEAEASMPSKVVIGAGDALSEGVHSSGYYEDITKAVILNNQLPSDVVQGEKVIANEFGVLLGLFQTFATLKASETAQVQVHFLDDLVRIISHNFQHYHALGEHNLFHDGKGLHLEVGLTHDPKEAMGLPQTDETSDTSKKSTMTSSEDDDAEVTSDDSVDFYGLDDERLKAVERVKLFIGKLGDFLNLILVSPAPEQKALNGEIPGKPDLGLFQAQVALDGMLTVRTVNGMVFEKTNWIRVPHRIRTPEDPDGDDGPKLVYPMRQAYEFDQTYTANGTPFLYYLQLRDFLAHLDDNRLSNFKVHEKDFYINDDIANESHLDSVTFVDPITATAFKRTRTLITILPNGGITLSDAWSSAIVMEGGNIYIQPANDLVLQPMRNLVAKVGGHVSVAAKKELDFSSTTGGLRIKTDKSQYLYSDKAGIALHAQGPYITDGVSPDPEEGEAAQYISGIVLNAPKSGVQLAGKQVYINAADRLVAEAKHAILETAESLHLLADNNLYLSTKRMFVGAEQSLQLFSKGSITLLGDSATVLGKKGQVFGVVNRGTVEGLIDTVDKNREFHDALVRITDELDKLDATEFVSGFKEQEDFDALKFLYPSSKHYGLTDLDVIPQTLTQLEDAAFPGLHRLDKWEELPINDTYPYPGKDRALCFIAGSMSNTEKIASGELVTKTKDLADTSLLKEPGDLFNLYTTKS